MRAANFVVLDEFHDKHEGQLLELFAAQWWTSHRTPEQARAAVDSSSIVFSAIRVESDELVGLARVLTDGTFIALVLDVIVGASWRGRGIGGMLLDAVASHPLLATVESVELVCQPNLVPFYARWGFTDQVGTSRLMRRTERESLLGLAER